MTRKLSSEYVLGHSGFVIRRILSGLTASGYIFRLTFRSLSDVLYSDECRKKKGFQYVKIILPLFRAVVKLFSTKRLFNLALAYLGVGVRSLPCINFVGDPFFFSNSSFHQIVLYLVSCLAEIHRTAVSALQNGKLSRLEVYSSP